MPFNDATGFVYRYTVKRADQLRNVRRLSWFSAEQGTLAKMIDTKFDRTAENAEWEAASKYSPASGATAAKVADINVLIGVRAKLGWMAGCNRDLRTQFGAGTDCHPRTLAEQLRYCVMQLYWVKDAVQRFIDITNGRKHL